MGNEITKTAFFHFLKALPENERIGHLLECFLADGDMAWELGEFFKEFEPAKLSKLIEEYKGEKWNT